MIEEIKVGQEEILFARHNGKLIYPKYASAENLVLHYDFSGRTNLDVQKGIAEDLSGNGNNGVLQNFAYTNGSGYLDNALIFDGIDDFITIPEPQIDLDNFTYSEGAEVLSFRGDEVATVVDGVVVIGGRNLIVAKDILIRSSIDNDNGSVTPSANDFRVSGWIGVTISDYTLSINHTMNIYWPSIAYYDQDKNFIRKEAIQSSSKTITISINDPSIKFIRIQQHSVNSSWGNTIDLWKLEKGTVVTPWTPAPEDLETTTFKPFFNKKVKSALYWNRALTDEELLQVYNTQIKRI